MLQIYEVIIKTYNFWIMYVKGIIYMKWLEEKKSNF